MERDDCPVLALGGSVSQVRFGFTIIELIVVMVLFGLVAAFAAPKIDLGTMRINGAVQVIGTTVLTAQRQAITRQHDIIVYFDADGRRVRVHEDRDNDEAVDPNEHVRTVNLGDNVVFGRSTAPAMAMGGNAIEITKTIGGTPALVFHRDGSASEAGGFYITSLRAQRDNNRPFDARAVTVERSTGRASWFRYRSDGWTKLF
jgi:prepilin-type N-terminal cleavage/methylation domain-containing protein